ncbi:Uncharacterised protein [uncultured archaeon]|nr:Uncharacterised protein [uncultured archaeon]
MKAIAGWLLNYETLPAKLFQLVFVIIPVLRRNALLPKVVKSSMFPAPPIVSHHFFQNVPFYVKRSNIELDKKLMQKSMAEIGPVAKAEIEPMTTGKSEPTEKMLAVAYQPRKAKA